MRSEDQVRAEVHALWTALFGEPPIVEAPPAELIGVLVASLPEARYRTIRRFGVSPFGRDEPPDQPAPGGCTTSSV